MRAKNDFAVVCHGDLVSYQETDMTHPVDLGPPKALARLSDVSTT